MKFNKANRRRKIRWRIRKNLSGTAQVPRASIYRSNKSIYCQLIDDVNGHTLLSISSEDQAVTRDGNKTDRSKATGKLLAEKAKALNIEKVVFDRGGYLYHGRVKALAEGAREGGLKF